MSEIIISRFLKNADRLGSNELFRFHAGGRWVPVGWRTGASLVKDFAAGLMTLGHEKGEVLAIVSNTRWEWVLADLGNLAAGGITVGVYPTMTAEQSRYVIAHSDARFLLVEDKKQLTKIEAVQGKLPRLEKVIVIDPTGVVDTPASISLAELLARGHRAQGDVHARIARLSVEDAATFVYTSGTTGPPKGAMITHGNIVGALGMSEPLRAVPEDLGFAFLPLAHLLQRMVTYYGLWSGIPGVFARSLDTIADDVLASQPSVVASVPRIFEKIYARVHEQAAKDSAIKARVLGWAVDVGSQVSRRRQAGRAIAPHLALELSLADRLVFAKLRARLGGRIRLFVTGGAPIAKEILEFFDAAGITILEGWGMTETCASGTLNLPGNVRLGSIGRPVRGVEIRLDHDGEMLIRGGNVFSGYYKDDEATRSSFNQEGFFRTGDIARVDDEGYYYIIDRKKDLIITAAGKNIAPQNIENLVKTDPRISQIVVIGDRRPFLTALVCVAPELRASNSEADLAALVKDIIDGKNRELASYERIKKFKILPEELTQEAGELTPTLKVKRKVVADRYALLIEGMYSEARGERRSHSGAA